MPHDADPDAGAAEPLDAFNVVRPLPVARSGDLQLIAGDIVVRVAAAPERSAGSEQWRLGYKAKDRTREVKLFSPDPECAVQVRDVSQLTNSTVEGLIAIDTSATDVIGEPAKMVLCNADGSEKHVRWFWIDAESRTLHWAKKRFGGGKQRELTGCGAPDVSKLNFETAEGQVCAIAASAADARAWHLACGAILDTDLDAYTVVCAPPAAEFRDGEHLQLAVGDTVVCVGPAPRWSLGYILGREPREVKPFPTGLASYMHKIGPEDVCELTAAQMEGLSTVDVAEFTVQPAEDADTESVQDELTYSLSGAALRRLTTLPGVPVASSDEEEAGQEKEDDSTEDAPAGGTTEQPAVEDTSHKQDGDDPLVAEMSLRDAEMAMDVNVNDIGTDAKEMGVDAKEISLSPSLAATPTNSFTSNADPQLEPEPEPEAEPSVLRPETPQAPQRSPSVKAAAGLPPLPPPRDHPPQEVKPTPESEPRLASEGPHGPCWKQKPTLRTWPLRYVRIKGKSLNVYADAGDTAPRGSSIADVTGCEIFKGVENWIFEGNRHALILKRADLMGGGASSFAFDTEALRDRFFEALQPLTLCESIPPPSLRISRTSVKDFLSEGAWLEKMGAEDGLGSFVPSFISDGFKKRFFKLQGHELHYYTEAVGVEPQGKINLLTAIRSIVDPVVCIEGAPREFKLLTEEREWHFRCCEDSQDPVERWVDALSTVAKSRS